MSERVLVVCSANQCRSVLAGSLLELHLRRRAIDAVVDTAGTRAHDGVPATPATVAAAAAMGVDLSPHRSRAADVALAEPADLVVTMERAHVRELVAARPNTFARTFTLKELARRGTEIGPRGADESLSAWLARAHDGRRPTDLLGTSVDDDVEDPTNNQLLDHHSTAVEIDDLLAVLVDLVWPPTV